MGSTSKRAVAASLVNIGLANADDPFYRYKMPQVSVVVRGRGNGVRTVVNVAEIAPHLGRDPEEILRHLSYALGACCTVDKDHGCYSVRGQHAHGAVVALLDDYIRRFVQCYKCGNPETAYEVEPAKAAPLRLRCKACRHCSRVDPDERLVAYILRRRAS